MKNEFVPYKEALALKELGFDEPCMAYHIREDKMIYSAPSKDNDEFPKNSDLILEWISAPLFQQAFKFFRENYRLSGNVDCCDKLCLWNIKSSYLEQRFFSNKIQSYEEAELECLRKLIEIVNEQKNIK